jgi:hypothetical protein
LTEVSKKAFTVEGLQQLDATVLELEELLQKATQTLALANLQELNVPLTAI